MRLSVVFSHSTESRFLDFYQKKIIEANSLDSREGMVEPRLKLNTCSSILLLI